MKKLHSIVLGALLLVGSFAAQAAVVTIPFQYTTTFLDDTYAETLGLSPGEAVLGFVTLDDSFLLSGDPVTIGAATSSTFGLTMGDYSFSTIDDMFGGAQLTFTDGQVSNVLFSASFNTAMGFFTLEMDGGFFAPEFRVLTQFASFPIASGELSSAPVPLPAAAWLLLSGLSALGWMRRPRASSV